MRTFTIKTPDQTIATELRDRIDQKTKPRGSLGHLETMAMQAGIIQQKLAPEIRNPSLIVFAGDHGIVEEGVSAYPQEVTWQMVMNFLRGGAAVNVFSNQHDLNLKVVDAGVKYDFEEAEGLIKCKIGHGTNNFIKGPAMSIEELEKAIDEGARRILELKEQGTNTIGFGEMGIGNTSSASMLMHKLTGMPLINCVGKGTGISTEQYRHKVGVLKEAAELHDVDKNNLPGLMAAFGGYEIAMMAGAFLQAAEEEMIILADGFIATSALLWAWHMHPEILNYTFFCHQSDEEGHQQILDHLGVTPILKLNMRLGEGTGCALAYPLLQSSLRFLTDMASFNSAGVSQ